MANNLGDIGNDIGNIVNMVNDMEGILPRGIYHNIVAFHDTDIAHGHTPIVI